MGYFLYQCNRDGHHHGIETDVKIRSDAKILCQFCKQPLTLVELGYQEEKTEEEIS